MAAAGGMARLVVLGRAGGRLQPTTPMSGEVRSGPEYYEEPPTSKLHLLRASTLACGGSVSRGEDLTPAEKLIIVCLTQQQHAGWQSLGAWRPRDLAVDLATQRRYAVRSGRSSSPG